MRVDQVTQTRAALVRDLAQPQGPERKRRVRPQPAAIEGHDLEAAAAEIAHQPVRLRHARDHAQRRQPRLLGARDDARRQSRAAAHRGHEPTPILGIAHRGGRKHAQVLDAHRPDQDRKPRQVVEGKPRALLVELAAALQPAPQPA